MSRYIGHKVADAVEICDPPPSGDVTLTVDGTQNRKGVWRKVVNSLVDTNAAIAGSKLAAGSGALTRLDDAGLLVNPRIKDTDASPVADRELRVIDGEIRATNTSGTEGQYVRGASLKEGTGPLTKLSATGFLDNLTSITTRVIDSLTDGTYARTLAAALSGGKIKLDAGDAGFAQPSSTSGKPVAMSAEAATTNQVKNPSFEVDVSGWNSAVDVDGGSPTITRSTAEGVFGSACAEYDTPSGTVYADVCDAVAASSGQQWVGSMWVRTTETFAAPAQIGIWFYDSATNNTPIGSATFDFFSAPTWQRMCVSGTAPASTSHVRLGFKSLGDWTVTYRIDAAQLELGTKPSGYCDGTIGSGYSWSGTAHASSSSRTAGMRVTNQPGGSFVVREDGAVEAPDYRAWYSGAMRSVGFVPIGAIVAWHKSITGCPALPGGWVECNGGTISDTASPMYGQTIPDLNGSGGSAKKLFLRGATTSGSTSVAANAPAHTHSLSSHTHTLTHTHTITSHRHYLGDTDNSNNFWLAHSVASNATGINTGDSQTTPQTGAASTSTTTGPSNNGSGAASGTGYDGSSNNWPAHWEVVWIMRVK